MDRLATQPDSRVYGVRDTPYSTDEIAIEYDRTLIEQAQCALRRKEWHGASAVAGAVLERHLRSLCQKHGLDLLDARGNAKALNALNAELYPRVYDLAVHQLITALIAIRNNAAHGKEATKSDASLIVEQTIVLCDKLK